MFEKSELDKQIEKDGHAILYKCLFGSHLYGSNSENSDRDFKAIFLPSIESCLLQNPPKSYANKTSSNEEKNTKDDVDEQYWSLQYWLNLLEKSDSNAVDLLYSYQKKDCVVYKHGLFDQFIENRHKLLNSCKIKGYIGYICQQSKKYGLKSSRLGIVKSIWKYLQEKVSKQTLHDKDVKLGDYMHDIFYRFGKEPYCFIKELKNGENGLIVCGSVHIPTITIKEFYDRIKKQWDQYGERARLAEKNEGIDWKALSHAVRCIGQMKEYLETGHITFPIKNVEQVKKIKYGNETWENIEEIIIKGIEDIERLSVDNNMSKYDGRLINKMILGCYDYKENVI